MTSGKDWQDVVGLAWAASYRQTDRSFAGLTPHLLERIAAFPGNRLLDIGCGAGEVSLAVAAARPGAQVTGLDLSENLIEAARQRSGEDSRVGFVAGDAAAWQPAGAPFDLLISRHGVMFFAAPPAAFAHLRSIAASGASLIFSCFRAARENPWASEIAAMLPACAQSVPTDPYAPGPFAFAETAHVRAILEAAGWQDIAFEPFDYAFVAGLGEDPVSDALAFFSHIGPAASAMRQLSEAERGPFQARLGEWLKSNRSGDQVAFPAAAWIVTARNG